MPQPQYACSLIWDGFDSYLFEDRPRNGRPAAGRLPCFGGAVEPGETSRDAIVRELREELQLVVAGPLIPMVELWVRGTWVARFFRCYIPSATELITEDQVQARWLTLDQALAHARISPWHAAVIRAFQAGRITAQSDD